MLYCDKKTWTWAKTQLLSVRTVALAMRPESPKVERVLMTRRPTIRRRNGSENGIQENKATLHDFYGCPSICALHNQNAPPPILVSDRQKVQISQPVESIQCAVLSMKICKRTLWKACKERNVRIRYPWTTDVFQEVIFGAESLRGKRIHDGILYQVEWGGQRVGFVQCILESTKYVCLL